LASVNREFWALPVFAGISLAYASWLNEPVLWFLVYLCLACMALAMLYRWRSWESIQVVRSFYTAKVVIEAGVDIKVILKVKTFSRLPWPWLELEDNLPPALTRNLWVGKPGGITVWTRQGALRYIEYNLVGLPRGIHNWDTVTVNSGDPLGLVSYEGRTKTSSQLVVYPRTIKLQAMNFFPRRVDGTVSAKRSLNHDFSQLVGIREYRPGDKLSLIHWKSTAKTNQLQTKEFAPFLMDSSLVVLDCSIGSWKPGYNPSFEEAITISASLVKAAWLQRIPVRFHSNQGNKNQQFSVASHGEFSRLLLHLATLDTTGRQFLSQSLFREFSNHGSNVVVITSGVGGDLQKMLNRLAARGNAVTVIKVSDQPVKINYQRPKAGGYLNMFSVSKAEDLIPSMREKDVN